MAVWRAWKTESAGVSQHHFLAWKRGWISSSTPTHLQASYREWLCFYCCDHSAWHTGGPPWTQPRFSSTEATYWQDHAVLEIGKFGVALLTAVQSILLIDHFLIAVLSRAGLVHAVLFAKIHHCGHRTKVVRLREKRTAWGTESRARPGSDREAAQSLPLRLGGKCFYILKITHDHRESFIL